jgi:capsular polysaccharide transport system ATP-binding protein
MIILRDVSKRYPFGKSHRAIFDQVNLKIEKGEKIGILGRNGSGKSTLVRLIGGAEQPSSGTVRRTMSVSWPIAFSGGFQGSLTGMDNLKLISRVYGVDFRSKISFVEEFAELGKYLYEPTQAYSSGMKARLAFAISMMVEFDCYLIDEVVAVGDQRFTDKCQKELFEKRSDRSLVIVSHNRTYIEKHCSKMGVLANGRLHMFESIQEGFEFYESSSVKK